MQQAHHLAPERSEPGWGNAVSEERIRYLRTLCPQGKMAPNGCRGKQLNGADIFWLAAEMLWQKGKPTIGSHMAAEETLRYVASGGLAEDTELEVTDLQDVHLEGTVLFGIDLENAYLCSAHFEDALLHASHLNHARLDYAYFVRADLGEAFIRSTRLRHADLSDTILSGADLRRANMQDACLVRAKMVSANLQMATLSGAKLHYCDLRHAQLDRAVLDGAELQGANLQDASARNGSARRAILEQATLMCTDFTFAKLANALLLNVFAMEANFNSVDLTRANLGSAVLTSADFNFSELRHSDLRAANLNNANLSHSIVIGSDLRGATFVGADLQGAILRDVKASESNLSKAKLDATDLRGADVNDAVFVGASFSLDTHLPTALPLRSMEVADVQWNRADLAPLRRRNIRKIGDERAVAQSRWRERQDAYNQAARAYKGLVIALKEQGLPSEASNLHYREQVMARKAQWHDLVERLTFLLPLERGKRNVGEQMVPKRLVLRRILRFLSVPSLLGSWVFSYLIGLLAGYGEKPRRTLLAYLVAIAGFTIAYHTEAASKSEHHMLDWKEALVLSISSFHGRGFLPTIFGLGDPITQIAAAEAIVGLFIELVFIATFSKRFLNT